MAKKINDNQGDAKGNAEQKDADSLRTYDIPGHTTGPNPGPYKK